MRTQQKNLLMLSALAIFLIFGTISISSSVQTVYATKFDPLQNGFRFDNNWQQYGFFEQFGLCGGMIFAALDFYYAGCPASQFDRPPQNSALYRHILMRQFPLSATIVPREMVAERFWQAVGQFLGPVDRTQNNFAYEKIRKAISSGQPVAIGIVGETGQLINSHVVLGYEISEISGQLQKATTIKVYDPNRPLTSNDTISIYWNLKTGRMEKIRLTGSQTEWAELRLINYQQQKPPEPCNKAAITSSEKVKQVSFNGVTIEFVWIPSGEFMMGWNGVYSDEKPMHSVRLAGFWLGKYEVTQRQWQTVMDDNPSYFKNVGAEAPVENVSWDDCQEFIRKLNGLTGQQFRLPTEAEWEYACRADTISDRYGDLSDIAWYDGNSRRQTHPVGQKRPNAWGLYDMLGNVWEWCQDWYGKYESGYSTNPSGPSWGTQRVIRGGSCYCIYHYYVRSTNRNVFGHPAGGTDYVGFRLALD